MKYYSTNGNAPLASLKDAVIKGLAPDGGIYARTYIGNTQGIF